MKDCTRRNDIVLDTLCGSGTTILAAERVGRRGYGLEIDPGYVDVTVRRWQAFSGRDALHVASGLAFEEIELQRCERKTVADTSAVDKRGRRSPT
jgi:DNA modification methylase